MLLPPRSDYEFQDSALDRILKKARDRVNEVESLKNYVEMDNALSCPRDSDVRKLLDCLLAERKNEKCSSLDYAFIVFELLRKVEKMEDKICELFSSNNFYVERYRAEVKKHEQPPPAQASREE